MSSDDRARLYEGGRDKEQRPEKRGYSLASQIEQEIMARGWPVGEVLGGEAELIERFGVSRSILREAVRILESRWVARMRPGPGGGLVVTAPDSDGVRELTRVYLDFRQVEAADLHDVWLALEVVAVATLAEGIDEDGVGLLRRLIDEEARTLEQDPDNAVRTWADSGPNVHGAIVMLTGNPALELFFGVVHALAVSHRTEENQPAEVARWLHRQHEALVDAIVAGDVGMAQLRVRRYISRIMERGGLGRTPDADELDQAGDSGS